MILRLGLILAAALSFALCAGTPASAATTWLCKPGLKGGDPCSVGLDTTEISPTGRPLRSTKVRRARDRAIDCFYVYPTVSD